MASVTDRRGPRSTDRNDSDGNLELRFDEFEIRPHRFRQRSLPFLRGRDPVGFGEVRPAFELAVDRFASRQNAHARGEFFDGFPVEPIAHTHWDPIEAPEHIEFRDREAHESVHPHGHPEHHEIEPADPPRPSRRRSVFASAPLAQIFRGRPFDFRGKRSGADSRAVRDLLLVDSLEIEAFRPAVRIDEPLLDRDDRLELLSEGDGIDEVAHADPETAHLVLERGTDPPERRAGSQVAFQFLLEAVDDLAVRHHDMRPVADAQVLHRVAMGPRLLDLFQELRRINHHAVPDYVHRAFPEDAGREQMKRVQLVAHLDGMARVRAALEPHDDVGAIGKVVDDLPLAFIAKLGSHHYRRGHANRRLNIAARLMVLWMADHATPDGGSRALGRRSSMAARRPRAITLYSLQAFARNRRSGREGVPYCPRLQTRFLRMSSAWAIIRAVASRADTSS